MPVVFDLHRMQFRWLWRQRRLDWTHLAHVMLLSAVAACALAAEPALPLYGQKGISPEAVLQGRLGSCYFHASFAALANADPLLVRGLLQQIGAEEYLVRVGAEKTERVYALDVDFARRNRYDRSDGLWVAVLLRAYAQRQLRAALLTAVERAGPPGARQVADVVLETNDLVLTAYDRGIRGAVDQSGTMEPGLLRTELEKALITFRVSEEIRQLALGFLDQQGFLESMEQTLREDSELFGAYKIVGNGGDPGKVLSTFIGSSARVDISDRQKVVEMLRLAHRKAAAVVIGTSGNRPKDGSDWWVPNHAYTVLDFDESADRVTIRNPWGAPPTPDGVFFQTLSQITSGGWAHMHTARVK